MPGSMQWHTHFAQALGLDVIWWTDHENFQSRPTVSYLELGPGWLDPSTLHVHDLGAPSPTCRTHPHVLLAKVTGGTPAAGKNGEYLQWELTNPSPDFERFSYSPRLGVKAPVPAKGAGLIRSIPSHPHIGLDLKRGPVGRDARVELLVRLSWHYQQRPVQQSVLYRFVGKSCARTQQLEGDSRVIVNVPTTTRNQVVDLDLYHDAALLPDGTDNDIQDFSFIVSSRNGATATGRIGYVHLWGEEATRSARYLYRWVLDTCKRYEASYGVVQHANYEIASLRTVEPFSNHFSQYTPDQSGLYPPYIGEQASYGAMSSWVHQHRGLMAWQHPFGTDVRLSPLADQDRMVAELAANLLQYDAYGADIIEVGYRRRGGCDTEHHLDLWDTLSANGRYLCGIGVSDSHGGVWEELPNPFVTWIWARSTAPDHLLDGLRDRRAYFGNPYLYQGYVDLSLGPLRMGECGVIEADESDLLITLDPRPAGADVLLVQGLIQDGLPVEYLHHRTLVDPAYPVCLDTSRSCFARVEVVRRDGEFLVGSNPIFVLKGPAIELVQPVTEAPEGASATVRWRVAGSVAHTGIRWRVGEPDVPPYHFVHGTGSGPVYEASIPLVGLAPGTVVSYRIYACGDAWVVWRPDNYELPLTISVQPSEVAGLPAAPSIVVAHVTASPTPVGVSITFSASCAARIQARILNIAGRPVKTLCRARECEAGENTLLWNTQADNGLRVPNGTYLVEVTAQAAAGTQARGIAPVTIGR